MLVLRFFQFCCLLVCVVSQTQWTYYATVTLSDPLDANVWIKFQSWKSGSTYETDTTPWNYVGPLTAGENSFSITTDYEGQYESRVYFGFYGTGQPISTTMTSLVLNRGDSIYYVWNSDDSEWNCNENTNGCCIIVRDTYLEDDSFDFQSNGNCNDVYSFESDRDGEIPTYEPTNMPTIPPTQQTEPPSKIPSKYPSNIPTIVPSANPSIVPTVEPTQMPVNPTIVPSNPPTIDVTVISDNSDDSGDGGNSGSVGSAGDDGDSGDDSENELGSSKSGNKNDSNPIGILLVSFLIGLLVLTMVAGLLYFRKTRQKTQSPSDAIVSVRTLSNDENNSVNIGKIGIANASPIATNKMNAKPMSPDSVASASNGANYMDFGAVSTNVVNGGNVAIPNNTNKPWNNYNTNNETDSSDSEDVSDGFNEGDGGPVSIVAISNNSNKIIGNHTNNNINKTMNGNDSDSDNDVLAGGITAGGVAVPQSVPVGGVTVGGARGVNGNNMVNVGNGVTPMGPTEQDIDRIVAAETGE